MDIFLLVGNDHMLHDELMNFFVKILSHRKGILLDLIEKIHHNAYLCKMAVD